MAALKLEQDPVHKHKDVLQHTLAVLERAPLDLTVRLAVLLHDIGKPRTRRIEPEGSLSPSRGRRRQDARTVPQSAPLPRAVVDDVEERIRLHLRFHTYRLGWTVSAVRRYVRDAGRLLGMLNDLVRADCTTRNPAKAARLARRMDELEALRLLRSRTCCPWITSRRDREQAALFLVTTAGGKRPIQDFYVLVPATWWVRSGLEPV